MFDMTHSVRCLAASVVAAVENLRDEEGMTLSDFRHAVESGDLLRAADYYLEDGLITCSCHVEAIRSIAKRQAEVGSREANTLAAVHLRRGRISPEEYVQIQVWLEGRSDDPTYRQMYDLAVS